MAGTPANTGQQYIFINIYIYASPPAPWQAPPPGIPAFFSSFRAGFQQVYIYIYLVLGAWHAGRPGPGYPGFGHMVSRMARYPMRDTIPHGKRQVLYRYIYINIYIYIRIPRIYIYIRYRASRAPGRGIYIVVCICIYIYICYIYIYIHAVFQAGVPGFGHMGASATPVPHQLRHM